VFDKWCRRHVVPVGGELRKGGGEHSKKVFVPGHGEFPLSTSKRDGSPIIPLHEMRGLARHLSYQGSGALRMAIMNNEPPRTLLAELA
jgi:hypothetical protein